MEIKQPVAWWLAELDEHGNPTLIDGAHADRAGADRAFYLHQRLGYAKGKTLAVARVEVSEAKPNRDGVNEAEIDWFNAHNSRNFRI